MSEMTKIKYKQATVVLSDLLTESFNNYQETLPTKMGKVFNIMAKCTQTVILDNVRNGNWIVKNDEIHHKNPNTKDDEVVFNWCEGLLHAETFTVDTVKTLLKIYDEAFKLNIPCSLVYDYIGEQRSPVCLTFGPAMSSDIEMLTKNLKPL